MRDRYAHAGARGALLSHLVGACFFLAFLANRAIEREVLLTHVFDWPIRLLALWLLIDRLGRIKAAKFSGWDWAHLAFVGGFGAALVYAELFMTRDTGFANYLKWVNTTLNGYFFFLVVREGLTRRGFRPDVVVRWMLVTLGVACLIAIAQARDIAHLRDHIDNFYHQAEAELHMEGPSAPWQARGPAVHANSLAIMLVCGLPLVLGLADLKKVRWFDWAIAVLMVITIFMTYSRTGIVSLAGVGAAGIAVLIVRRRYLQASGAILAVIALGLLFTLAVYAFNITRFKVLLNGTGFNQSLNTTQTVGWRLREQSIKNSVALAAQYPITGLAPASGALNDEDIIVKSPYNYPGLLLDVYVFSFVAYGLIGVIFLASVLWLVTSQVRNVRTRQAFAAAAFVVGVALAVSGIAENVLFYDQAMITVNILMAFCVMRVSSAEPIPRERVALA